MINSEEIPAYYTLRISTAGKLVDIYSELIYEGNK